jgi:SAM-dependent methyltransferase
MDHPSRLAFVEDMQMNAWFFLRQSLLALCLSVVTATVFAQPAATEYKPSVGQEGKDVVWVPTPETVVEKMLEIAKVTARDYLIDLGSGDGRTVIAAAKRGARALGIEYNPEMVELSKRAAAKEGVTEKAQFVKADLFETDFSKASVITMFLLPDINLKLRPKILDLKPGTRIVSNSFTMGEWKADQSVTVKENCTTYCTALLWIVPAKVAGNWHLKDGELHLKQEFQTISGSLVSGGVETPVKGKLNGDNIVFTAGKTDYVGRVSGSSIEGNVKGGGNSGTFSATRTK